MAAPTDQAAVRGLAWASGLPYGHELELDQFGEPACFSGLAPRWLTQWVGPGVQPWAPGRRQGSPVGGCRIASPYYMPLYAARGESAQTWANVSYADGYLIDLDELPPPLETEAE